MGADQDELLSATEAAHYLKLRSRSQMHRIALVTGMGRRIGYHWMLTRAELDAYAATRARWLAGGGRKLRAARVPAPPAAPALAEMLDINAAAARLGVSVKRVYQLANRASIGTRHGTRWLFTPQELDAYAATRRTGRPRKRS